MSFKDFSLSAWVAGALAVLISYCGPLVIFIQAAQAGGMDAQTLSSWIWAISLGAGLSGLLLSAWLRQPIITAWSAPGTALLLSLFPQISMAEVVGAYLTTAVLVIAIGVTGCFERIVRLIPKGIAAGMLAGILFQFGAQAFRASADMAPLVFAMLAAYLLGRRLWPRYAIVLVAGVGLAVATLLGDTRLQMLAPVLASPVFVAPAFGWSAFFSFTVPLLLVSLTGQYLPGMSLLRLAGYQTPSRAVLTGTGLASLLVACFGGITIVLASITAALCTGADAHADARRRYVAGIASGIFYLVGAAFAGSIVLLFNAFPPPFIAALAGLALIGAIASNLELLAQERGTLEASVIAFLATASGMSLFGLGAAFWGVVLGMASHLMLRPRVT
ncbi:MAG: benzoate/H(+) symporter BenE family transporter [Comamonas sp.]|uniref:benzoate/H(+) symporter BenE family transporter n=1 Tax=Comamonas sp. TaxID=34028 RepID=UPI002FC7B04B